MKRIGGSDDATFEDITTPTGVEPDVSVGTRHPVMGFVQIFPRVLAETPNVWITSGSLTVGRSSGANIKLADPQVSRFHLRVFCSDSCLRISDLGSRHGTRIDGIDCGTTEQQADAGSVLRVGNTLLLVVAAPLAYASPAKRPQEFSTLPPDTLAGPTLWRVWREAIEAAQSPGPVLIVGERGTDKEALARLIHGHATPELPFHSLALASLPANSLKAEVLAALSRTRGTSNTRCGTLLLEGVESLWNAHGFELLSLLEAKPSTTSAESAELRQQPRVILTAEVTRQQAPASEHFFAAFRERLKGSVIEVPPLRARRDEVILAALAVSAEKGKLERALRADTAELLALSSWEGNDHQLRRALRQAARQVTQSGAFVRPDNLPGSSAVGNSAPESTVQVRGEIYSFRDFDVDADVFELRRNGVTVPLQPRVFDLLLYLVRNPNRVVTRDELLKGPWKGTSVVNTALNQAIMLLRRAVDEGEGPTVIRTIRQRGFQFDATVSERGSGVMLRSRRHF